METFRDVLETRKGKYVFDYFRHYNKTHGFDTYAFIIWDETDVSGKRKADISLLIMDDNVHLKVIDLFTNDYKGKGIAVAIILKAKLLFRKRIISSSNTNKSFPGEANSPEAIEKIWEPLVAQGLAIFDGELYRLL